MYTSIKILAIVGLAFLSTIAAQAQDEALPLTTQIQQNFANYIPSEKIYLHTDKPNYFIPDTIWFKGYLLNAADLSPALSNFIQVELIDVRDTVIISKKIKRDTTGVFKGYLEIDGDLPANDYTIRAYSLFMQNYGREYFFYKNISLGSLNRGDIKLRAQALERDSLLTLKLFLSGAAGLDDLPVECSIRNLTTNKRTKSHNEKTNSLGVVELPTAGMHPGDVVIVDLKGKIGRYSFANSLRIEIPKADYDLQFLPEGGDLVEGGVRRVAFKSVSSSGNPIDVSGCVIDDRGDTVAVIEVEEQGSGMGVFALYAQSDRSYVAHTRSSEDVAKTTELPKVAVDGVALMINMASDQLTYTVDKRGVLADAKMYVLLHSGGRLQYIMPIDKESAKHSVPLSELPAGVSNLVVVNDKGEPVAERLLFVQPRNIEVNMDIDAK